MSPQTPPNPACSRICSAALRKSAGADRSVSLALSEKADINLDKHEVSFQETCEVFLDPFLQPIEAREVEDEAREAVVGLTTKWRLLRVAYTWRELALRIISARKATKPDRKAYENQ